MIPIKVLVIGAYGFMMNHLIHRLNREKCDVYTIAGAHSKDKAKKLPAHTVFEFTPDSMAVQYIMQCIGPDCVIFMGAQDDAYDWEDPMTCSFYMQNLMNVLIWAQANKAGRFVYLSTAQVYEGYYEEMVTEETEPVTVHIKNRTIYNGECICKTYQDEHMDVVILRMPILYGPGHFTYEKLNLVERMCFQIEKDGRFKGSGYGSYMTIYVSDAVDAVYKAISAKKCDRSVYHISGNRMTTDKEICGMISGNAAQVPVPETEGEEENRVCPDGTAFEKEFSYFPHIELDTGVERTGKFVKKHYESLFLKDMEEKEAIKKEQKQKVQTAFGLIVKNVERTLENIVLFLAVFFLASKCNAISMFENIDFLLFYVILTALNLGVGQSVFAVLLATMGHVWFEMQKDGLGFAAAISGYPVILRFLFYFILAIMISYRILRRNTQLKEKDEQLEDLQEEYELIYDMNKANIEIKKVFEERLINYGDSIGKIYNIVSELDVLDPEKIEDASLGVICRIMNVKDVCIYKIGGEDYYHFINATTEDAKSMKRSINLKDYAQMRKVLESGDIFINHNIGDELPRMAAPIFSDDRMIYIIMLWNMEFEQLNIYQKTLFLVLAKMITSSLKNGYQYEEAGRKQNYYENTDILVPKLFMQKVSEKMENIEKADADYTIVWVDMAGWQMEELSRQLRILLRDEDKIGKLKDTDTCLYLLVHASHSEITFVINRLSKNGIQCRAVIDDEIR